MRNLLVVASSIVLLTLASPAPRVQEGTSDLDRRVQAFLAQALCA